MKTFVVGYINFYDHEMILEKIVAKDWREAICKHSKSCFGLTETKEEVLCPKTIHEMCEQAFDMDMMMNVIEI